MNLKILMLLSLVFIAIISYTQNQPVTILIQKIAATKDDDVKVDLVANALLSTSEADTIATLQNQQAILSYAVKNKDYVSEAMADGGVGYAYRHFGNYNKSLQYAISGYAVAEKTGNQKAISATLNLLGNCYKDLGNYPKALDLYRKVIGVSQSVHYTQATGWGLENVTEIFILTKEYDSALIYAQKDYEIETKINTHALLSYTLINLAAIHGKMGDEALAKAYYDMAITEGMKNNSPKEINWAYTSKAEYFIDIRQSDSAIITAKLAINAVSATHFANYALKPAELLLNIYRTKNIDSAFKYGEIFHNAKDSLFSAQVIS